MSQVDTEQVPAETTVLSGVPGVADVLARLRATYASGVTRDAAWREAQLDGLARLLTERETELTEALAADLGKPFFEAWAGDLAATRREVEDCRKHVRAWMRPEGAGVPWILKPGKASIVREPLGTVLIISPWNYPVHLLLTPLAAALAAGNTVVCKPSEVAPATSTAIARLLPLYVDPDAVAVVEGGVAETTALLELRWDHILYTGNGTVGRIVAAAAAKHLTPVTLELGGKSPVIIAEDANLKLAASRIAFAKWSNAGQTCIAADHVWVHRSVEERFVALLEKEIRSRYGADPRTSPDYGRVVNSRHTARIGTLLDAGGYDLVCGGQVDVEGRYVAPTVLRNVKPESAVMGEEIFGPVLPVLAFDDVDEPIAAINAGDKPLALYVFTASNATADKVLAETSSGGACVNEALAHIFVSSLPFGGVGESGYGAYHGRWGFETFSHRKAVLRRPSYLVDAPVMKAPYKSWKLGLTRKML